MWRREKRRGGGTVFDGGRETSRVMNFSAGSIRGVIRTRTGVRKQVVPDICSAWGPGCPCRPLTLSPLSLLAKLPSSPSVPPSAAFFPAPPPHAPCLPPSVLPPGATLLDCQQMQKRDGETENESETGFFFFLFVVSHLVPEGLQHQR